MTTSNIIKIMFLKLTGLSCNLKTSLQVEFVFLQRQCFIELGHASGVVSPGEPLHQVVLINISEDRSSVMFAISPNDHL